MRSTRPLPGFLDLLAHLGDDGFKRKALGLGRIQFGDAPLDCRHPCGVDFFPGVHAHSQAIGEVGALGWGELHGLRKDGIKACARIGVP